MARGFVYLRKPKDSDVYADITSYVQKEASGGESVNTQPMKFSFETISQKSPGESHLDIEIGDYIAIAYDDSYTEVFAEGIVIDPGRQEGRWSYADGRYIYRYNVQVSQPDVSDDVVPSIEQTQINYSTAIEAFLAYADESIGSDSIAPYILYFTDYQVDAVSVQKTPVMAGLADFVKSTGTMMRMVSYIEPDATNLVKITRQLEFLPEEGIGSTSSAWATGITDDTRKTGKYLDASDNALKVAEGKIEDSLDLSSIVNHLELSGHIYASDDNSTLSYWTTPALFGKFEYQSPFKTTAITCVGLLIKAKILTGSTSTTVNLPSRLSEDIQVGNLVIFPEQSLEILYTVATKNKVDSTYTEFTFEEGTLPFTPATGDNFWRVGNYTMYDDNQETEPTSGVAVDTTLSNEGFKLRFYEESEPPEGNDIIVFFSKIIPHTRTYKNQENINTHGLKYKEIQLPDDIVLTRSKFDELGFQLLQLKENRKITIPTRRDALMRVGTSLSLNVTDFLTDKLILRSLTWKIVGASDPFKKPAVFQTLNFETRLTSPEQLIGKLKTPRKSTKTAENVPKYIIDEAVGILDEVDFVKNNVKKALVYVGNGGGSYYNLYRYNLDGSGSGKLTYYEDTLMNQQSISIHPAGAKIAYCYDNDIYEINIVTGAIAQITNTGNNTHPHYSEHGGILAFKTDRSGTNKLAYFLDGESDENGDTPAQLSNTASNITGNFCWVKDGNNNKLVYGAGTTTVNLYTILINDTGNTLIYSYPSNTYGYHPYSDPTGTYLSANMKPSAGDGFTEVYQITPISGSAVRTRLTTDGGTSDWNTSPSWSQSDGGAYIYWCSGGTQNNTNEILRMDAPTGANKTSILSGSGYYSVMHGDLQT